MQDKQPRCEIAIMSSALATNPAGPDDRYTCSKMKQATETRIGKHITAVSCWLTTFPFSAVELVMRRRARFGAWNRSLAQEPQLPANELRCRKSRQSSPRHSVRADTCRAVFSAIRLLHRQGSIAPHTRRSQNRRQNS